MRARWLATLVLFVALAQACGQSDSAGVPVPVPGSTPSSSDNRGAPSGSGSMAPLAPRLQLQAVKPQRAPRSAVGRLVVPPRATAPAGGVTFGRNPTREPAILPGVAPLPPLPSSQSSPGIQPPDGDFVVATKRDNGGRYNRERGRHELRCARDLGQLRTSPGSQPHCVVGHFSAPADPRRQRRASVSGSSRKALQPLGNPRDLFRLKGFWPSERGATSVARSPTVATT